MPDWSGALVVISAFYGAGGLGLLVANYRRLTDVNERRRVRVLVGGATLGCVGGAIVAGGYWLRTGSRITDSFLGSPMLLIGMLLAALALPLSFAYAILRHRLFDVAVILRQGVRYALARGVLVSLVPALAIVVVADLLTHAADPLATTLRVRGWIYAVIGGLVLAAHRGRVSWLDSLDRRFFRERYDAQQLLRQIATDIRDRADLRHAASRVVAQIDAALHPELTAILTRDADQREYRSLAAAPAGLAPPPLQPDSKLIGLIRILGKPMEVGPHESSWLTQQLPHRDTDYLRQARIDLIVPISVDPSRTEAILVLGRKRSEEPYSQEDQDLLVTIAGNLALVLDRRADTDSGAQTFEECPQCGTCYDTGIGRCAQEGTALQTTRLPRMLAARYRLDRRLGSGGMGTVYGAIDRALDRPVAAKVLRDDLVDSAEAAERFKREARTAASFAHPNVVTVHDFGLTSDSRAFLIMELLTGRTLRDAIIDHRRLTADRVVAIVREVCAAVDAAHRRQIVHRDLKPENIFLVQDEDRETAKVLDFGIAKPLPGGAHSTATSVTGAHQLLGTLAYMAPEQLRGEEPHPAWDVWALAIVTYELLTGAHPFARHPPALLAVDALRGRATSIREHLNDVPAPWSAFFERALAVEPGQRPGSAREFLTELERVLARSSTVALSLVL
jgi:protein kinase-like protein